MNKLPFVLVHGAWHGGWCFERVTPLICARGHIVVARDLPGHGLNARFPAGFGGVDRSPVAGVTLDDYANSVIETIDHLNGATGHKVVLVAHSMGGITATAVAERVPNKIAKLIYLCGFMPSSGVTAQSYIQVPENDGELVSPQLVGSPATVGALRMDHQTAGSRLAFYADIDQTEYDAVANLLTPDAPAAPFTTPVIITQARWGSLPRHYIRTLQDLAIRPALQQRFIEEADRFVPANCTHVHELNTSHSPFISRPSLLAELLVKIATT